MTNYFDHLLFFMRIKYYCRQKPPLLHITRRSMSVKNFSTAASLYEKFHLKKLAIGEWPWQSLKVIAIAPIRYVIHHTSYLWSEVGYQRLYLAPFRRYYHFYSVQLYMPSFDRAKSFSFESTGHMRVPLHMQIYRTTVFKAVVPC